MAVSCSNILFDDDEYDNDYTDASHTLNNNAKSATVIDNKVVLTAYKEEAEDEKIEDGVKDNNNMIREIPNIGEKVS